MQMKHRSGGARIVRVGEGSVRVEARVPALRFGEAHGQSSALPLRKMFLLAMLELAFLPTLKTIHKTDTEAYWLPDRFWDRSDILDPLRESPYRIRDHFVMGVFMLRDKLAQLQPASTTVIPPQIAEGDNAHHAHLPIQDRQTTKLPPLHDINGLVDVLVFMTVNGRKHHDFPHSAGSRVAPLGRGSDGEVSHGQQPHDFQSFAYRKHRKIVDAHFARGFTQRSVRTDDLDISLHNVFELRRSFFGIAFARDKNVSHEIEVSFNQ